MGVCFVSLVVRINYIIFALMKLKVVCGKEIHIMRAQQAKTLQSVRESVRSMFRSLPARNYLTYFDAQGDQITLRTEEDYSVLRESGQGSFKLFVREKEMDNEDSSDDIQVIGEEICRLNLQDLRLVESGGMVDQNQQIPAETVNMDDQIEIKLKKMMPVIVESIKSQITEELTQPKRLSRAGKGAQQIRGNVVHSEVICDGCQKEGIEGIRYKCAVCFDFDLCERCEGLIQHPHPFLKIKTPSQTPLKLLIAIKDEQESLQVNGKRADASEQGHWKGSSLFQHF